MRAPAIGWPSLYVLVKACLALGLWGVAAVGYFQTSLAWWERLWAAAAAALLVLAVPATDEAGFVLALAFIGFHLWRTRRLASPAAHG